MPGTLPAGLGPSGKLEARLEAWCSPTGREFTSAQAAAAYGRRTRRFADVVRLRRPDRVPRALSAGGFVARYTGLTHGDFMYEYGRSEEAIMRFHRDFDLDFRSVGYFFPGRVLDRLGYLLYQWPGGALSHAQPFQAVEGEYMMPDEYGALIADPEGFALRVYLPRVFGSLAGLAELPSLYASTELPLASQMSVRLGAPGVRGALRALLEAGEAAAEWAEATERVHARLERELGLPALSGGTTKVPFDFIGDTLRGTRGVMLDMFRRPTELLAACEALVPIAVGLAVESADASGNPFVTVVLHKGADGFMSPAAFERFYWPGFKATLDGMIAHGVIPCLFVEGSYDRRLDFIAEAGLPSGKMVWMFDQTDMAAAKRKIGPWAGVAGNVPASLFKAGTPGQMEHCVARLLELAAPDGGFCLAPGASIDDAEEANVRAYLRAGREYGSV